MSNMEQIATIPPPAKPKNELPEECCGKCRFAMHPPQQAKNAPGQIEMIICLRYPPQVFPVGLVQNKFLPKGPPEIQTGRAQPTMAVIE